MAVAVGVTEAMASKTWESVRDRVARVLGRGDETRARSRAVRLDGRRAEVAQARRSGDGERVRALVGSLAHQLELFLDDHPDAAPELRALLAELPQPAAGSGSAQQATVRGDRNTVLQAGRDLDASRHRTKNVRKKGGGGVLTAVVVVAFLLIGAAAIYHHVSSDSHDTTNTGPSAGDGTSGSGATDSGPAQRATPTGTSTGPAVPQAALSAGANGITGSSTCGDWLGADEGTQYAAVQRISVAEDSPLAANPFPVQEMKYDCGSNTRVQLARVIWDLETPHGSSGP